MVLTKDNIITRCSMKVFSQLFQSKTKCHDWYTKLFSMKIAFSTRTALLLHRVARRPGFPGLSRFLGHYPGVPKETFGTFDCPGFYNAALQIFFF